MKIIPKWHTNIKYWRSLNTLIFGKRLTCPRCGSIEMKENYDGRYVWCKQCRSKHRYSSHKVSFLYGCKLQPKQLYQLIWCFIHKTSIETMRGLTGLSYVSIDRWLKRFRENIPYDKSLEAKLSGVIKVDESFFGKQRSKQDQVIVIGAINADSGHIRLETIQNRNRDTLEDFILRNIEKGSTIVTDSWKGYLYLHSLGYNHIAFNHQEGEFAHTNQIEGLWSEIKNSMRRTHHNILTKDLDLILREWEARHNKPLVFSSPELFLKSCLFHFS
jgi:Transposase and inactivated derivatives